MSKLPWFPLYAADFLTDTQDWEVESIGAYFRLLCYQWINGSIPSDIKKISKLAGVYDSELIVNIWEEIQDKFHKKNDGTFINKRLEKERKAKMEFLKNASESGKKGAKKRWGGNSNPNSDPIDNPNGNQNQNQKEKTVTKKVTERKQAFVSYVTKINEEKNILTEHLLQGFIDYWTERSPRGKQMRYEKETTYDHKLRMHTWKRNNRTNFGRKMNTPQVNTTGRIKKQQEFGG